jgi:DNA-binding YbaB/EbfC family protein
VWEIGRQNPIRFDRSIAVFKELLGLGSLMKQAQQIGGRMKALGEELKKRRATGTAGGGMVEIEVNGLMEVLRCRIDPQLIAGGDRELIEDLVATAINQTIAKGKQLHADAVRELAGNIHLPGLEETLAKFMGTGGTEGTEGPNKE